MAPQYVKLRVQTNKSDAADARAICRAVQEPGMRCVGIATEAQQEVQALQMHFLITFAHSSPQQAEGYPALLL